MLKRIQLTIFCYFLLHSMIFGQPLSLGPMLGANFMSISNTTASKTLVGLSIGGFANYSINEHLGINAKLLYSQMGTSIENSEYIARLNYLQLPLSAVYFFGNVGNTLRPKIFAGPYAAYLFNAKDHNDKEIVYSNGEDVYFKSDFGGVIGVGLNFIISDRKWLNIDATYSTSFYSIVDAPNTTNKNNGFQLNAGVSFPIGK
ncbi:MAG: PorT family protein [Saprospiraceae bacterium]|nr:PorT family protein [Saprospiraceae bacterium]